MTHIIFLFCTINIDSMLFAHVAASSYTYQLKSFAILQWAIKYFGFTVLWIDCTANVRILWWYFSLWFYSVMQFLGRFKKNKIDAEFQIILILLTILHGAYGIRLVSLHIGTYFIIIKNKKKLYFKQIL